MYEKETQLTQVDIEQIQLAIVSAYPDIQALYRRISNKWGVDIADVMNTERGKIAVVTDIVAWARADGETLDLLALCWTDKPGNPKLAALAQQLLPADLDKVRREYALPPLVTAPADPVHDVRSPVPSLERIVSRKSRLQGMDEFIDRLRGASGAVCRISVGEDIAGTGFLIGHHSVLTNYHVVKAAVKQGLPGDRLRFEFDFRNGTAASLFVGAAGEWLRASSPYSESDLTGIGDPPADSLDFALIDLARDVEADREALFLRTDPPAVSPLDLMAILQHPGGDPLKIAWGKVLEFPGSGMRYRYDVTTEAGSSGSPVMSPEMELMALHHAADPSRSPRYNQGVPIWRIARALVAEGIDLDAL